MMAGNSINHFVPNNDDLWMKLTSYLLSGYPFLTERYLFCLGTLAIYYLAFWGQNLLLYLMYKFSLFKSFQIQPGLKPPEELVWKNLTHTIISHLTVLPLMSFFFYDAFTYFGTQILAPLPPTQIILRDLFVALICVDAIGYWGHRTIHHKSIYKYIHKQHHEYKVTVGIASVYANPIEDLFVSTLSSLFGPLVMGSHVVVLWLWLFIRVSEAVSSHSGYHFLPQWISQWFSGGDFHEYHHSHNIGNYGAFTTFWDRLMGTDVAFQQYLETKQKSKAT